MGKSPDQQNQKRYLINKIISKNSSAAKAANKQEHKTSFDFE
jgi:hypothetical protein